MVSTEDVNNQCSAIIPSCLICRTLRLKLADSRESGLLEEELSLLPLEEDRSPVGEIGGDLLLPGDKGYIDTEAVIGARLLVPSFGGENKDSKGILPEGVLVGALL